MQPVSDFRRGPLSLTKNERTDGRTDGWTEILVSNIGLTYFASFTGFEYDIFDIFEVIFNLHVQGSKFNGKFDKCGIKSF